MQFVFGRTSSRSLTGFLLPLFLMMPILFVIVSCSRESGESHSSDPASAFEGDELTVGTFNIKWLGDGENDRTPRTDEEIKLIAECIRDTRADVLALQEIENGDALARLTKWLPDFDYIVSERGGAQRVAFLFRSSLQVTKVDEFEELAVSSGLRPGLIVDCRAGEFDVRLMAVHFKATSSYDNTEEKRLRSYNIRREQSAMVNSWFEGVLAGGAEDDVIVLGDYNDNPVDDATPTLAELENNRAFRFLTGELASCKNAKWTSIDHIAVSPAIYSMVDPASVGTYSLYHRYKREVAERISDHCPVLMRFALDQNDSL